ncbi:MAG: family 78 glycoside hydrolase catalytic domain [Mangrovibacterium sp.]|nr:family 78 glycoside hydrolase catalytic domain [Mangrovibacterium sp.]
MKNQWNRKLITALFCLFSLPAFSGLRPVNLRCEYKTDPVGIDTPQPRFSWMIDSREPGVRQRAYQLCVADSKELLRRPGSDIWNTGKICSGSNFSVVFPGITLEPARRYFWKVRIWDESGRVSAWSRVARFSTALLSANDWDQAKWIGYESLPDSMKVVPFVHGKGDNLGDRLLERAVNPCFRKRFNNEKQITEAYAFVCGLGQYELIINGKKVSDDFLVPGWTNYAKSCQYNSYDVTNLLQNGENVIGCLVGSGFFYINRERYRKLTGAFGFPMLRMILHLRYSDGKDERIATDESWKTFPSPIEYTSIYGSEDYNAGNECSGWDNKGFDDSGWEKIKIVKGPGGAMKAQLEYPVNVMEAFEPEAVYSPSPGKYVYDFGQNASGIVELRVSGQKGDTVRITPGELLDKQGMVSQKSSGGPFYFEYILKGGNTETWRPRFSYYGFRYAMVEGAAPANESQKEATRVISMKHLHVRNSMPAAGSFKCSGDFFNRIFNLIDWVIKSNLVSVSSDCPHREKLGWLEQAHLMGESVKYRYDLFHLYNKIVDDMLEAQTEDGMIPSIAPEYVRFDGPFRDDPGYGSAMIILPWYLYKWYSDKRAVERAYPAMERYIAYLASKADSNILSHGLGDWLDVGPMSPGISQLTPVSLTATAFYYYNALLMSNMSAILERPEDQQKYSSLAIAIRNSFNRKFFDQEKRDYGSGSQTANAMPLYLGMTEQDDYRDVLSNLKKTIANDQYRITAGDIGHRFLVQSLNQAGESQLLFDMNNRTDSGYGYQLKKGATALNENWSGEEFLSQNHMIMGHLLEWFNNGLAGIGRQENDAGYTDIVIEPQIVNGIDWVEASYQSMNGEIGLRWEKGNRGFLIEATIPCNSRAEIILPAKSRTQVAFKGKKKETDRMIQHISEKDGKVVVALLSGSWKLKCNYKKRK